MSTDWKHFSDTMPFSEDSFLRILAQLPVGVLIIKKSDLTVRFANDYFFQLLSLQKQDVFHKSLPDLLSFGKDVERHLKAIKQTGGSITLPEAIIYLANDAKPWYFTLSVQLIVEKGHSYLVLGFSPDALDRERLRLKEERLKLALHGADLGTWDLDPIKKMVSWDDRCRELYGFPKDGVVSYDTVIAYTHPDDQRKVWRAVNEALDPKNTKPYEIEFRTIGAADHKIRWLRCRGKAYFNNEGQVYRFSGTAQDISEEMELRSAQDKLRALVETSTDLLAVFDSEYRLTYVNDSGKAMLGLPENYAHLKLKDFYDESIEPTVQAEYLPALLDNKSWAGFFVLRNLQTGEYIPVQLNAILLADPFTGEITGRGYQARDLRRDIQAKQELEESQTRFRNLIMEAPIPTAVLMGEELRLEIVNTAALQLWDKGTEVVGLPIEEVLPEWKDMPQLLALREDYVSGKTTHGNENVAYLPGFENRKSKYINFIYKLLHGSSGQVIGVLITGYDVTTQVEAHKRIKESEKRLEKLVADRTRDLSIANKELQQTNDSLQQFAYAASHDLQEPLRKIQSFSSLLLSRYAVEMTSDGLGLLTRIQAAADRMSGLVKDLLMYSQLTSDESVSVSVDLNELVAQVLSDMEIVIDETHAQIQVEELPVITGNERQLTQLLQNLISNAIKFHRTGEVPLVYISSERVTREELPMMLEPHTDRTYVCVKIRDEGIGFEEKYLDRIFQMFQRLHDKQNFSGTGVGLALCKKVVDKHQGYITAQSSPEKGTLFLVYLPE